MPQEMTIYPPEMISRESELARKKPIEWKVMPSFARNKMRPRQMVTMTITRGRVCKTNVNAQRVADKHEDFFSLTGFSSPKMKDEINVQTMRVDLTIV